MAASNSRRQLAFIPETVFGTTPATPQTQLIEFVSFDADLTSEQLNSAAIRADRQIGFSRRGNLSAEGSLVVEMAPDNYDTFLEATLGGTWTTNVLKIGNTARSFAFEEGFMDIAQFRVFNGVTFNSLSMEVTPDALVQATFGLMGSTATAFTGTSIDSTPTAITKKDVFFHEGGTINEGGAPVAFVTGITFELTNNLAGNRALGSSSYRSMTLGRAEVTGTVTALFESVTLYNKYRNSTTSSLSFVLSAGSPAETLTFTFPDVRYTSGTLQRADTGPVLVELGFTAVYDSASATSLQITRSA
jgi:hypothetical protein